MLFYIAFSILQFAHGMEYASLKDQCINLCQNEKLPVLEPNNFEKFVCQSGCRFFNIIKFGGGLDLNPAIKHCHITCNESYSFPNERKVCTTGCKLVASEVDVKQFLMQATEEKIKDIIADSDLFEADLLSDPSFKSQLEVGFNVDYKIPETHIRTMPIENKIHNKQAGKETGDWLDCASKNSGIPRWILLSIMLGTIMVAIWLTLSMEARKSTDDLDEGVLLEIPSDLTLMENFIIEKDPSLYDKENPNSDNVKFIPPPKYSEINETDSTAPPKYSEVVENNTEKA